MYVYTLSATKGNIPTQPGLLSFLPAPQDTYPDLRATPCNNIPLKHKLGSQGGTMGFPGSARL